MLRCCALHSIATPNLGASPRSCGDCLCPLYICWWDGGGISGRTHPDPRSTALSNSPQRELPALLLPCCRPVAHTAHRGELSTPHTPLTADPSLNQRLNYYSSTIPLGQARPSSARCRLQVPTTGADAVSEGRGQRSRSWRLLRAWRLVPPLSRSARLPPARAVITWRRISSADVPGGGGGA